MLKPGAPLFLFEYNPYKRLTLRVVPFDEGIVLLKPRDTSNLLRQTGFTASPPYFSFFFLEFLRTLRLFEPALSRISVGAQYFVVGR